MIDCGESKVAVEAKDNANDDDYRENNVGRAQPGERAKGGVVFDCITDFPIHILQSLRFQLHIVFRFSRRCFITLLLAVRSHLREVKTAKPHRTN
jgi:hypothetical protein